VTACNSVRCRFLFREVNERGYDLPLASVTKNGGVEFRADLDISVWNPGDDTSMYKRVLPGDFVIGLRSFQSGIGYSPLAGLVSPAYTVLRPLGNFVDGFYRHFFKSQEFISRLENVAQGIRQGRTISTEAFYGLHVPVPPIAEQRAIADYLDAETARIDALIEKKRRMVALLDAQREAFIDYVIWTDVSGAGPLKHRTDQSRPIMYGIVLPGPSVSDGVPIVKGGDVAARRLSPELLNRTTPAIEAPYVRARLAPNDLVFAIRGGVGDVEIVPPELAGANITQDVARVSCADDVRAHWLHFVLQTARVKQQVEARTTGATIRGLNIWELKRIQVPMSNLERQESDLDRLQPMAERNDAIGSALASQIDLLIEHRQALITAAVTGELTLPGVAA